jgi:hypothetical protein
MRTVGIYNSIARLLAIAVLFSTVAPVSVFAQDTPLKSTIVISSHTTGGVVSSGNKGMDGTDGADGKPGENGSAGADGVSTMNREGNSFAFSGSEVVTGTSSAQAVISSTTVLAEGSEDQEAAKSLLAELQETLLSLQIIVAKYVSLLL